MLSTLDGNGNRRVTELRTERLLLRGWRAADRAPFADLNASLAVMEFALRPLTRDESDALVDRIEQRFRDAGGWGYYALEDRATGNFIGFTGMSRVTFNAEFTPAVEIGWRLMHAAWGRGLASEAARAVLAFAFDELKLSEVVAFSVPSNTRSLAVMHRLGMSHDPGDDFDHPSLPDGSALRRHVLYRLNAVEWATRW